MLRVIGGTLLLLAGAALASLALFARDEARADFVVSMDEIRTIDPQRLSWLDEIRVANALFEGLTRLNDRTFLPEPGVARHWEISADQTEYVFFLRPDAVWSNGEPVSAEDFRFAWLRALEPSTAAQYASLLFVIEGAEKYYRSRLNDDPGDDLPSEQVGVIAEETDTLRVRLRAPCSYFLDLTSFPTFAPVHPPTLRDWAPIPGEDERRQNLWTRPDHIVNNGAFLLRRWDFKQRLLLERNPNYWDRDSIHARRIEFLITSDMSVALLGYETGRIDLVTDLPVELAQAVQPDVQAGRRSDFHVGDRFATFFLRVNCRRPPLDDPRLRQALALAIDKEALCRHVLGMGEQPADTHVPPGSIPAMPRVASDGQTVYYHPAAGLGAGLTRAERLEEARRLLRESGFDRMAARRPIEIAFVPHPRQLGRLSEAIQRMWEQELGIRVELRVVERKVISQRIRELDYDLARSDWYGDYMDPGTFLDMFTSESGNNRTGWSNAEYDRLIAAAAVEPDNRLRYELFSRAERILCEDELPIIPIYFKRGNYLLRPGFDGLRDNVRGLLPLHRVVPPGTR